MLKINSNPLLTASSRSAVNLTKLAAATTLKRNRGAFKRELRDARRMATAVEAIAGFDRATEIFGFTRGQFSLLHLIQAAMLHTGPAHVSLSTWTAAAKDIDALAAMRARGDIVGLRMLVDLSMSRREPAEYNQARDKLGAACLRSTQTHCKFALLENAEWKLVIRTSMNLNQNPRNENFTLAHDPELAAFLNRILDEVWAQ